jgi:hypothetical protein
VLGHWIALHKRWSRLPGGHALQLAADTSGAGADFDFDLPVPGATTYGVQWAFAVPGEASDTTREIPVSVAYDKKVYIGLMDASSLDAAACTGDATAARSSLSAWVEVDLPAAANAGTMTGVGD